MTIKELIKSRSAKIIKLRHSDAISVVAKYLDAKFIKERKIFWIDDDNIETIQDIFDYFLCDKHFELKENRMLNKSILLIGNVGSGKTVLMEAISKLLTGNNSFQFKECYVLADKYISKEYEPIKKLLTRFTIERLINHINLDDLGSEDSVYGKEIMDSISKRRNTLWVNFGVKTHYTTNLSEAQIKKRYGERVISRILQGSNVLYLGKSVDSLDRRTQWKI